MRAHAQPSSVPAFPASRSPAAQAAFVEGVAWLHSFEYEEAIEAFRRAQQIDPRCAMAYWGEAMCYHQSLWLNEDLDAGRRALARLAPTPAARAARAPTDRERRYLAAVEALFGEGDRLARVGAYAEILKGLAADYPDDLEARAAAAGVIVLLYPALRLAREIGSDRLASAVLLGALSDFLSLPHEAWREAIRETVPKATVEANLVAFETGAECMVGAAAFSF